MPLKGGNIPIHGPRQQIIAGARHEKTEGGHTAAVRCAFSGGYDQESRVRAASFSRTTRGRRYRRRRSGRTAPATTGALAPAPGWEDQPADRDAAGSSQSLPGRQLSPAAASARRSRGTPKCRSKTPGVASQPTRNGVAARSPEADGRSRPPMRRRRRRDQWWPRHQPRRLTRPPAGSQSLRRRSASVRRARLRHARPFLRPSRYGSSRAARRRRVMRSARLCGVRHRGTCLRLSCCGTDSA